MAQADETAAAPRIPLETAWQKYRDGSALFVDVRGRDKYDAEHIPGARSIPVDEIEQRLQELPRDRTVIFYCT